MAAYLPGLRSSRFVVTTVTDGEAALRELLADPPDLVLAGTPMLGLEGTSLLQAIRTAKRTAALPVIVLSAPEEDAARVEAMTAGANDYLVRPFSQRELMARIENQFMLSGQRQETQQRLRTGEERLRALAGATFYTMFRIAPDWSQMQRLSETGFVAGSGEPHRDWLKEYIRPEDLPRVQSAIEHAIETRSIFDLEHRVRGEEGRVAWTHSRAVPLLDDRGEILEWFGATGDITQRKHQQEDLAMLAAIVSSADDAIISKDLNGVIRSWNGGAVKTFGYTAEETVGRSILMLIPEDLWSEEDLILGKLRAGERIDHYETVRRKKNGETIEVSLTVSPIRDEAGVVIGASKIARDISDRRRMERLLIQSEKLSATGRMAASIAHEINNPLESLINLIYLARRHTDPASKAHGYLVTAEEELDRVSQLARQTLGYYRDTSSLANLALGDLIQNVLTVYRSRLLSAGIEVDLHCNDVPKISARKGELLQVFSNVIANAIDAMSRGGTLRIAIRKVIEPPADGLEVVIRDSGAGISSENLSRIFEPFFTTKGERGSGIGLWVTRQLVEARGGHVSASSSVDPLHNGTSIIIFLPFALPAGQ